MEIPYWKAILKKKETFKEEITRFLSDTALFENLSRRILKEVASLVHIRNYKAGEEIFRQGEVGSGLYLIQEGRVLIASKMEGVSMNLADLPKGAFFGELSLFTDEVRTATATATEDSILIGFFQPDLKKLIERKPKVGIEIVMSIASVIAQRLSKTNQVLEKAYFKGKVKRDSV
ncbi:MAG: cyclic nucleotide-binding domain-containing protein [Leptospiraceae bacterium]|nr:cyclic nucleotide-binding domain-containing protein [Leptospiraceae bacterium]MCK6381732.1 cyclic nucleotide-binding domain-containing protein [Leptospiraceae bacterium]NUM42409.1 cyclic nucleotide-binding domain-containing protein [Leptospiraceae bacterium]